VSNLNRKQSVLIISLPEPKFNYGGVLQSAVLWETLKKKNYDVRVLGRRDSTGFGLKLRELLSFCMRIKFLKKASFKKLRIIAYDMPNFRARDSWMETVGLIGWTGRLSKRARDYDIYVVGSDQVFRNDYFNLDISSLMFLGEMENKLRFSYAASFGKITAENSKWLEQEKYRAALGKFSQLSVRENSSVIKLRENFNIESVQISDPCFLFTRDEFKDKFNFEEQESDKNSEYVFVYTLSLEGRMEDITLNYASNLKFVSSKPISLNQNRLMKLNKCILNLGKPQLPDFLRELSNSSLVITDSFHGVVLSIIFERDFRVVLNEERGADRILDLLEKFGLTSRLISHEIEWEANALEPIDWKDISAIREKEMKRGNDFLDFNLPK